MPLSISSLVAATFAASHAALALPPGSPSSNFPHSSHADSLVNTKVASDSSWPIKQARSTGIVPDGTAAVAEIYQKYKAALPEDVEGALSRRQNRAPFFGYSVNPSTKYLVPVQVGSDQSELNLMLDVTSAGIFVFPQEAEDTDLEDPYTPYESSSAVLMKGYSWEIKNPVGKTASGEVYQEVVSIESSQGLLTSEKQAIQVINSALGFGDIEDFNGILGMAFSSRNAINPKPQPSFFDNIVDKLTKKIFTVDIKHFGAGELDFSYINEKGYTGKIGYADVLKDEGYWNFTIGGLVSDPATPAATGTEYVVADTAMSILMLPAQYNTAYYNQIPNAQYSEEDGGYIFPCDNTPPNFSFRVGDVDLDIPGEYMKFAPLHDDSSLCFGGLQSSEQLGFNLIGNIAFKSAFVVFDPINAKIGWARKTIEHDE